MTTLINQSESPEITYAKRMAQITVMFHEDGWSLEDISHYFNMLNDWSGINATNRFRRNADYVI